MIIIDILIDNCIDSTQHVYVSLSEIQIRREEEINKNPISKVSLVIPKPTSVWTVKGVMSKLILDSHRTAPVQDQILVPCSDYFIGRAMPSPEIICLQNPRVLKAVDTIGNYSK